MDHVILHYFAFRNELQETAIVSYNSLIAACKPWITLPHNILRVQHKTYFRNHISP